MLDNPLANDLDHILEYTTALWPELRGQRIFITGGTGFFGCWLLESFVWVNTKLDLQAQAVVLTRNKKRFSEKCPHLFSNPALHFHEGDVRDFKFPSGEFSHVIHAATEASVQLNESKPVLMLDTIIQGTKHTLEFAKSCKARRFLLVSSGAVYGKQPHNVTHLSEDHPCQPSHGDSKPAYAVGKYTAEHMGCLYGKQYGFEVKIARCFAFVGPYLPLNIQYAIGNFIRDGLCNNTIIVNGDGTPHRSYLYAADLATWLWTILFCGESFRHYNVGSDESISIADLANLVAGNFEEKPSIKIMRQPDGLLIARYVPDVMRARKELHLTQQVSLKNAIHATIKWYRSRLENTAVDIV